MGGTGGWLVGGLGFEYGETSKDPKNPLNFRGSHISKPPGPKPPINDYVADDFFPTTLRPSGEKKRMSLLWKWRGYVTYSWTRMIFPIILGKVQLMVQKSGDHQLRLVVIFSFIFIMYGFYAL